jgi:HTH-type transcriptional regulator, competence development regulator
MKLEKTFGDTVKKLREEKNLPLREVAEALNIDTSMLGKIEKNSRKPTKQIIEKFAAFFKVSGKDLTIAFLSDTVAYQVMEEEDFSSEVFKVAEEKVEYLKTKKPLEK